MDLHKNFLVVLVVSLVVPIAAVAIVLKINVRPSLLPLENEVLGFTFRPTASIERKAFRLDDLRNPINQTGKDYPPVALADVAPAEGSPTESHVSLIVLGKRTKMAVVKGAVLKEGDTFQGARVSKIEKDRVLLKNGKEEKWLVAK